jgi:hypothetical protein
MRVAEESEGGLMQNEKMFSLLTLTLTLTLPTLARGSPPSPADAGEGLLLPRPLKGGEGWGEGGWLGG